MADIASFFAGIRAAWLRLAGCRPVAEILAGLGPNLRKEAGLAPAIGTLMF